MISYKHIAPLFLILSLHTAAQPRYFADSLDRIAAGAGGPTGIALLDAEGHRGTAIHTHDHFPLLSVFKFPLALCILDQADKGKLSLDERITIHKDQWKMASPFLNSYNKNTVTPTIRELLAAIIKVSDNVACDVLLQRIGGPSVVNAYVHGIGIKEINIAVTETQMAADPKTLYENWCTPFAMNTLLQLFYEGHVLPPDATSQLTQLMTETTTGPHRLKGLLPPSTIVAHKTGTSNTDPNGLTAATNDVGVITLPNGHHLYITVFVSDSHADEATREGAIAHAARLAYDTYSAILKKYLAI